MYSPSEGNSLSESMSWERTYNKEGERYIFTPEEEERILGTLAPFDKDDIFPHQRAHWSFPIDDVCHATDDGRGQMPDALNFSGVSLMCLRRAFRREQEALATKDPDYLSAHLGISNAYDPYDYFELQRYQNDRNYVGQSAIRRTLLLNLNACIHYGMHRVVNSFGSVLRAGTDCDGHHESYVALLGEIIAIGGPVAVTCTEEDVKLRPSWVAHNTRRVDSPRGEYFDFESQLMTYSPIFLAVLHGCTDAVELLLSTGCVRDMGSLHRLDARNFRSSSYGPIENGPFWNAKGPFRNADRGDDWSLAPPLRGRVGREALEYMYANDVYRAYSPLSLAISIYSASELPWMLKIAEALLRAGAPLGPPTTTTLKLGGYHGDSCYRHCHIFGDLSRPSALPAALLLLLSDYGADFSVEAFARRRPNRSFRLFSRFGAEAEREAILAGGPYGDAASVAFDQHLRRNELLRTCCRDFAPLDRIMESLLGLNPAGAPMTYLYHPDPGSFSTSWFWSSLHRTQGPLLANPLIAICACYGPAGEITEAVRGVLYQVEFYASSLSNCSALCRYISACHANNAGRMYPGSEPPPPTFTAAERSNKALLLRRLTATFINMRDADGNTALHHACGKGLVIVVGLLLKLSADANAKNRFGETPLHAVCRADTLNAKLAIAKKLLDCGADPEERCLRQCRTPYDYLMGTGPLSRVAAKREREVADAVAAAGGIGPYIRKRVDEGAKLDITARRLENALRADKPAVLQKIARPLVAARVHSCEGFTANGYSGAARNRDGSVVHDPTPAKMTRGGVSLRKIRTMLAEEMITRPHLADSGGGGIPPLGDSDGEGHAN